MREKFVCACVDNNTSYAEFSKFKHIVDNATTKRHELLEGMIANFMREENIPLERISLVERRDENTVSWFIGVTPEEGGK